MSCCSVLLVTISVAKSVSASKSLCWLRHWCAFIWIVGESVDCVVLTSLLSLFCCFRVNVAMLSLFYITKVYIFTLLKPGKLRKSCWYRKILRSCFSWVSFSGTPALIFLHSVHFYPILLPRGSLSRVSMKIKFPKCYQSQYTSAKKKEKDRRRIPSKKKYSLAGN